MCQSLLHLLFGYALLLMNQPELWTSAVCGTSSDLMASVCSFYLVYPERIRMVSTDNAVWLTFYLTVWLFVKMLKKDHFIKLSPLTANQLCHLLGFRKLPPRLRNSFISRHRHFTRWNDNLFGLYSPFKAHITYIKNRRFIAKIKAFGSYQTLCLKISFF